MDSFGRVQLKGEYENEDEVDLALSLAQTVVGVRRVSPVTPQNIKNKAWEKRFSNLFKAAQILDSSFPGPIKNKYAIIIGVGKFKNPKINTLKYAVHDASVFYKFLTDPQKGAFPPPNVMLLTDEKATKENIVKELKRIQEIARPDDLVCVYMSSHGTPPKFGGVYIVTYDTVVEPRQNIWKTSLSSDVLEDFIQNIQTKRLVMIMDACYSNGAYKNIPGFNPPGGKSLGLGEEDEYEGISRDFGKKLLGAKDIIIETEPVLQKPIIENDPEGFGKVLISASGANERSWESDTIGNSYFTYFFIDGLEHYNGSVKKAFNYAQPKVSEKVKQEKGYEQNPQVMATQNNWDMSISKRLWEN